jgi:hypothetical protein
MRETESWIFASTNNQIQTSLALAYNLGFGSENTPWTLLKAAKEIGLTIPPEVLARANKLIK